MNGYQYLWTLPAPDPTKVNGFGSFIAATANVLALGDPADGRNGEFSGVAHVYSSTGTLLETLVEPGAHARSMFGASGILSDGTLYVGAHGIGTFAFPNREIGAVYQYQLVPEPSSMTLLVLGLALAASRRRHVYLAPRKLWRPNGS